MITLKERDNSNICEACRLVPVTENITDDDPDEPYRVCYACGKCLRLRALRPLEWFNLAAKHGWRKHLLHDDFYDQDGTAPAPDIEDYAIDGLCAPTLREAAGKLSRLVDFSVSRWYLSKAEYDAFKLFSKDDVLHELAVRAEKGNSYVLSVALELSANVLEHTAMSFVRGHIARACSDDILFSWSEAAAKCLPKPEGEERTVKALASYSGRELHDRMLALVWFRSRSVLDWIERRAPPANISQNWGCLAALSDFSWTRAEAWLAAGRPLSLIALDALKECIPSPRQAFFVQTLRPRLAEVSDRFALTECLRSHSAEDTAPRVTRACDYIINHIDDLLLEDIAPERRP